MSKEKLDNEVIKQSKVLMENIKKSYLLETIQRVTSNSSDVTLSVEVTNLILNLEEFHKENIKDISTTMSNYIKSPSLYDISDLKNESPETIELLKKLRDVIKNDPTELNKNLLELLPNYCEQISKFLKNEQEKNKQPIPEEQSLEPELSQEDINKTYKILYNLLKDHTAKSSNKELTLILTAEEHNTDKVFLIKYMLVDIAEKVGIKNIILEITPQNEIDIKKDILNRVENHKKAFDSEPSNYNREQYNLSLFFKRILDGRKLNLIGGDTEKDPNSSFQHFNIDNRDTGLAETVNSLKGQNMLIVGAAHIRGISKKVNIEPENIITLNIANLEGEDDDTLKKSYEFRVGIQFSRIYEISIEERQKLDKNLNEEESVKRLMDAHKQKDNSYPITLKGEFEFVDPLKIIKKAEKAAENHYASPVLENKNYDKDKSQENDPAKQIRKALESKSSSIPTESLPTNVQKDYQHHGKGIG